MNPAPRDGGLTREVAVRLDTMMDLAWRIGRQRDRWYRSWKWTFGALLLSVIGHIGWILGRFL